MSKAANQTRQYWDFPIPIYYGPGVRHELATFCRRAGVNAPLVVTDRGSSGLPFVAEVVERLKCDGLRTTLFHKVNSNPTELNIADGIDVFLASRSDGVIALGGGSGMDTGKAISFVAAAGAKRIWDFDFSNSPPPDPDRYSCYPVVCIPTTAGTGAETDSGAIVTDTVAGVKRCVYHPIHKPAMAVLDPELTLSLPPTLTAWTGVDALVHGIEAFLAPQFHPLCDGIALQSVNLVSGSLRQAVRHGDDLDARAQMLTGSCLAGVAFMKGLGLVHSISHMIGAVYDTHHGLTNAVVLPAVLKFNRPAIEDKIPALSQAMGLKSDGFEGFYGAVVSLLDDLDVPDSLAGLGVEEEAVRGIARKTMTDLCLPTNPREVAVEEVETLLYSAISKAR